MTQSGSVFQFQHDCVSCHATRCRVRALIMTYSCSSNINGAMLCMVKATSLCATLYQIIDSIDKDHQHVYVRFCELLDGPKTISRYDPSAVPVRQLLDDGCRESKCWPPSRKRKTAKTDAPTPPGGGHSSSVSALEDFQPSNCLFFLLCTQIIS